MTVNYDRVCRLCLSSRGELLPIFPTTSSDDMEPPILASKIKDCVAVEINENDDLPTNVCRKCVDNVNNWHLFKSVCSKTQNKLLSLTRKDGSLLEEVQIKSEPLFSEEAYDDGVVIDGSYPESENAGFSCKLQPEGPPILASLGLTPRSDKKYVDPRMDWQRVHAILDIVQNSNVIDSLQTVEETDVTHHSDHESETEAELQAHIDNTFIDCKEGYACKNNKIFSLKPQNGDFERKIALKVKKRKVNAYCRKPKSAWQLLFTDDLLDLIVASTNENLLRHNGKDFEERTNVGEIKTLIGILYLKGIMRPTHQKCSDLWDVKCGVPAVINAMTHDRFNLLIQNICFYTQEDEDTIMQFDTMKRIRKVFEIFALNCRATFDVQSTAVVDEIIVPVYGPCPFRYDIDKKPLKSGIKMVLLVDPSNFYVSNLDVITDPYFGPEEIVKKITQHLYGTGKTIIMDSWFYSSQLLYTLKNYELYTVAALHPVSEEIPPLFLSQYRKNCSYISGFVDGGVSLTSHVTDSKATNVVTNLPQFYRKGHTNHTTSVAFYKKNHSAVQVLDVLMHYYTTLQYTNDWTLSMFFTLLNIASVNAQVIWSSRNTYTTPRRSFIKDLALGLLDSNILSQSLNSTSEPGAKKVFDPLMAHQNFNIRGRCRICATIKPKRDRRTRQHCMKCDRFICREHSVTFCTICT